MIAIDTRRRLVPSAEVLANDLGQHCMTTTVEQPVKHEYDRIPYLVAYQNTSGVRDVYGGVAELVVLESYLLKPKDTARPTPCWCSCTRSAAAPTCR